MHAGVPSSDKNPRPPPLMQLSLRVLMTLIATAASSWPDQRGLYMEVLYVTVFSVAVLLTFKKTAACGHRIIPY